MTAKAQGSPRTDLIEDLNYAFNPALNASSWEECRRHILESIAPAARAVAAELANAKAELEKCRAVLVKARAALIEASPCASPECQQVQGTFIDWALNAVEAALTGGTHDDP